MRALWTVPQPASEMVLVEDVLVIANGQSVVAFDAHGKERWNRELPCLVRHLTRCGRGVAFAQKPHRNAPTLVRALDLAGNDLWRYERAWGLLFNGIAGDDRGVVLYGQDDGPGVTNHWVGIDAATGAVAFEVPPPTGDGATLAGDWMIASLVDGDGSGGVVRTTRDGADPTTITTIAHLALAANRDVVLLRAGDETVAIELATGRERWRAPGGENFEIAIDGGRCAWVESSPAGDRPVVYDVASGSALWRGAPLPTARSSDGYRCKLGDHAIACYSGFTAVTFYSLASAEPIRSGPRDGEGLFWRDRFVEPTADGLTCWEMP